jgi:hypothetical protein
MKIILNYLNAFIYLDLDVEEEYENEEDQINQTFFFFLVQNEFIKAVKALDIISLIEYKINLLKIKINNTIINFYLKYYKLDDFYLFFKNTGLKLRHHKELRNSSIFNNKLIKFLYLLNKYLNLFIFYYNIFIEILDEFEVYNFELNKFQLKINKYNYIFYLFKKYNYFYFKPNSISIQLNNNLKLIFKEITFFNTNINYTNILNIFINIENTLNYMNYFKHILYRIKSMKTLKNTNLIRFLNKKNFLLNFFIRLNKIFSFLFIKFKNNTELLLLNYFNNNFIFFKDINLFFKLFMFFINLNNFKYNYILQICNFIIILKLLLIFYYFLFPFFLQIYNLYYFDIFKLLFLFYLLLKYYKNFHYIFKFLIIYTLLISIFYPLINV